jgi:hypothetical protein
MQKTDLIKHSGGIEYYLPTEEGWENGIIEKQEVPCAVCHLWVNVHDAYLVEKIIKCSNCMKGVYVS